VLPGRNLEALQNIGLKRVNRGGKTNRRRERSVKRENVEEYEDTKRREVLKWRIGRRMGEGGEEGGEKARKSENEYGLTRV